MLNLDRMDDNFRTAIARRKDWKSFKVELDFTLSRHEIMLADVVTAESPEKMEKAYTALQRAIHDEGGFHSNRKLGHIEIKAGDHFTMDCSCGERHQGIVSETQFPSGVVAIGSVVCEARRQALRERAVKEVGEPVAV